MLHRLRKTAEKLAIKPSKKVLIIIVTAILSALGFFYYFFATLPSDFPLNSIYSIPERRTLSEVALEAKKRRIIKSSFVFKIFTVLFFENKGVISGDYILNKKENVFEIARRFSTGDYQLSAVKTTIPEGLNIYEIADILSGKEDLRNFNSQEFLKLAKDKEGYLYPDTYFFSPNIKAQQIIGAMEYNFKEKIAPIQKDLNKFDKTFKEVLTMASILEDEVRDMEDRKIVAGILWKRIKIGMPLQVDAVFPYITGKKKILSDDLKIDSPYNTYLYKGLPLGPISNPGLDAILAAGNPKETEYLFYISDKKGVTHFASTLEEHNSNIEKYLR